MANPFVNFSGFHGLAHAAASAAGRSQAEVPVDPALSFEAIVGQLSAGGSNLSGSNLSGDALAGPNATWGWRVDAGGPLGPTQANREGADGWAHPVSGRLPHVDWEESLYGSQVAAAGFAPGAMPGPAQRQLPHVQQASAAMGSAVRSVVDSAIGSANNAAPASPEHSAVAGHVPSLAALQAGLAEVPSQASHALGGDASRQATFAGIIGGPSPNDVSRAQLLSAAASQRANADPTAGHATPVETLPERTARAADATSDGVRAEIVSGAGAPLAGTTEVGTDATATAPGARPLNTPLSGREGLATASPDVPNATGSPFNRRGSSPETTLGAAGPTATSGVTAPAANEVSGNAAASQQWNGPRASTGIPAPPAGAPSATATSETSTAAVSAPRTESAPQSAGSEASPARVGPDETGNTSEYRAEAGTNTAKGQATATHPEVDAASEADRAVDRAADHAATAADDGVPGHEQSDSPRDSSAEAKSERAGEGQGVEHTSFGASADSDSSGDQQAWQRQELFSEFGGGSAADGDPLAAGGSSADSFDAVRQTLNEAASEAEMDADVAESLADPLVLEEFLVDGPSEESLQRTGAALKDAAEASLRQEGRTVQMELSPVELGTLKIRVTQLEHSIETQILASEPATSELLMTHREQLTQTLADLGFETSDVEISYQQDSHTDSDQSQRRPDSRQPRFHGDHPDSAPAASDQGSSGGLDIVA